MAPHLDSDLLRVVRDAIAWLHLSSIEVAARARASRFAPRTVMTESALWAIVGVLYRTDVALDARELRAARRLVERAMRLVLDVLDDMRARGA